jgi:thiamine-phosphate pyrophosphorylase
MSSPANTVTTSPASPHDAVPRLHIVTDTRGGRDPLDDVRAALSVGARVIQVRDKHATDRALLDLTRRVLALAAPFGAWVLVDDRIDVAAAAGAHGAHLGADDLPVADARRLLGAVAVLGATARTPDGARAAIAAGATYLGVGPAFATRTKDRLPAPLGPSGIAVVAAATSLPVIAIGGVRPVHVPDLLAAGAHGVAVVTAISEAADAASATLAFLRALPQA